MKVGHGRSGRRDTAEGPIKAAAKAVGALWVPVNGRGAPDASKTSWWIEPTTRESFNQAVAKEHIRNRLSKAARTLHPINLSNWSPFR